MAFVDVETTGSSITGDRIMEIGILRVENNSVVETFSSLINPHTYVPEFISGMTGITSDMLQEAPSFEDIAQEIYELLEGCVFVAHNVRFDYGFIRNEFKRFGYSYSSRLLCTAKFSRALFPQYNKHNLDSIMERFGLACENRHRAFDDAKVMWEFYEKVITEHTHLPIEETLKVVLKQPSVPLNVPVVELETLPEGPGVYLFYGEGDVPLYIGKSNNIRERVLSHFSGDHTRDSEMIIAQQMKRIETIETAGELGALLLEAKLVKEKKPMFNKRLRSGGIFTVLFEQKDEDGYYRVHVEEVTSIPAERLNSIIAVTRSKKKAKEDLEQIAKTYGLCKKLLGLEKTSGSCFGNKLGSCNGACVKEEDPEVYNLKHIGVFSQYRIKPWPYNGPVLYTEHNGTTNQREHFIIDKWCYLGTADDTDLWDISTTRYTYEFDHDMYMILKAFLKKKQQLVVPLDQVVQTLHRH